MERGQAGSIYNVGGGSEATLRDAITTLEEISGRQLPVIAKPAAKGDVRRTAPDTARVETDLGWTASTTLEAGLQAQWEWATNKVAAG
jgi:nucleoside-diphosphate-sugar epimerase